MDLKRVEELLEKYLDAQTSTEEEAQLRAYFGSGEVEPHLKEYQLMFGHFDQAREAHYEKNIRIPKNYRREVYGWVGIAVSILLLAGIFLNPPTQASEFGTYDDPAIALEKTKEALNFLSRNLHAGNEELGHLQEFNRTKNELIKTTNTIE